MNIQVAPIFPPQQKTQSAPQTEAIKRIQYQKLTKFPLLLRKPKTQHIQTKTKPNKEQTHHQHIKNILNESTQTKPKHNPSVLFFPAAVVHGGHFHGFGQEDTRDDLDDLGCVEEAAGLAWGFTPTFYSQGRSYFC